MISTANISLRVGKKALFEDVNIKFSEGECYGLIGANGAGKSTFLRILSGQLEPTSGEVIFNGNVQLDKLSPRQLREFRPKIQIIFQDPYASLSPRLPVGEIIGEAVREHHIVPDEELDAYVSKIMKACGLFDYQKDRYPHEFSGGQRQRICIARAIALNPDFIVCDEPVSALDVSVQNQILNLLKRLQESRKLAYLFISHDLSVIRYISDRTAVMYLGKICETGPTEEIFRTPLHPYTRFLTESVPLPDPHRRRERTHLLSGEMPSPVNPPAGCRFHTRCPYAAERCAWEEPQLRTSGTRQLACHLET